MTRILARLARTARHARAHLSACTEEAIFVNRALRAGACGYVTEASAPNIAGRSRARHRHLGKRYISADIAQKSVLRTNSPWPRSQMRAPMAASPREEFEKCCACWCEGLSVRDIAQSMGLNPKTVAEITNLRSNKKLGGHRCATRAHRREPCAPRRDRPA